mgnify:CR=1 FL=1
MGGDHNMYQKDMPTVKDGGPAFPTEVWDSEGVPQHTEGMTLRDYFAAKATQAFLSKDSSFTCPDEIIAQDAYNAADAMLKARKK